MKIVAPPNAFEVGEKVHITEIERQGRVMAIYFDGAWQYKVRYFDNAFAKSEYFYADEIELVD